MTNFDNIWFSLLSIFIAVTLEGWSSTMLLVMTSTHYLLFLLFIPLVFIGAYFLLNLTLAVINNKFTQIHQYFLEKKRLEQLKKLGLDEEEEDRGESDMKVKQMNRIFMEQYDNGSGNGGGGS